MAETTEQTLPEKLLTTLRTWSNTTELIYNTAQMRYWQKKFFKDRTNECLVKAKEYEKIVDGLIDRLWPDQGKQSKLF